MLFGLLIGLFVQIVVHGCTLLDNHGGSDDHAAASHHRVIIVVPKEIKHIHHYKYIPAPKEHKHTHHHHEIPHPQHHNPPHNILHPYEPQSVKHTGYEAVSYINNYPQLPVNDVPNRYRNNPQAPQVYEPPVFNVGPPSRQEIKELLAQRPHPTPVKLADRVKPQPNKGFYKSPGKEAKYLNFGFRTQAKPTPPAQIQIPGPGVQKPKTNVHFDEPYKFQDPFVNAFPQLQQAFNIHSSLNGNTANQAYGTGGAYLTNSLQNYNNNQLQSGIQTESDQPFDPYAHITHHPHGLVHVDLGNSIDGEIKQIEINNDGDFQANLENDFDEENDDETEKSEEEDGEGRGGGEGGEEEEQEGSPEGGGFEEFDDFFKEDNQKHLPYSGVMGHGRALDSIYPKGPMMFSHEHYDVAPGYPSLTQNHLQQNYLHQALQQVQQQPLPQHPLQQPPLQQHPLQQPPLQQHPLQHHPVQQTVQQGHILQQTPTPAPTPLQPLYHRQFVPIQHLQAPPSTQEEHSQFLPVQNFNYNTFHK